MKQLGLILLLFSSLFVITSVQNVSGIEFTSTDYWFYINEPTTINYTEMVFSFKNVNDFDVRLNCEQKEIDGLDITTYLDWNETILEPNTIAENHYAFEVNATLGSDYLVQIYCYETIVTEEQGQKTSTGGIITSRITYYSDDTGSFLDMKIVDQSGSPRNSTVKMMYKRNESLSWSPFNIFTGNRFLGYLPDGLYHVIATDLSSSIIGEEVFLLDGDMEIEIELFLLGFGRFEFMEIPTEDEDVSVIGINGTINNFLGPIEDANVYLKLFKDGEMYSETQKFKIELLPLTTDYEIIMWFAPINWEVGNYTIVGFIDRAEQTLSTKILELGAYESILIKVNPKILYGILFFILLPSSAFIINRKGYKLKYVCKECDSNNFNWYKFCNKCGNRRLEDV